MQRIFRRLFEIKLWPSRLLLLILLAWILDARYPLPPPKPYSTVVLAADGSLMSGFLSSDDKWRMHTRLDEVSPELVTALLEKEDRWFWSHPGVNPAAILRAIWSNVRSGKRMSGASTITMQLARMMEPKERTLSNKFLEMLRAFQLEWHHSKQEILEMYLSYLPYGGNIEGVKAASYIYYDRPPEALSLSQATLLTVIPNRPNSLRLDQRQDLAKEARDKWLRRFRDRKVFPASQVSAALNEPIEAFRHAVPLKAPHLSRRLAANFPFPEVRSSIDPEIQLTAERLLANYVRRLRSKGITNGSLIVLDNQNSAVLAYCGSADYADAEAAGQVDGVQAIRSPGSTLKPAVYALAFDRGIYVPDTRVLDVPRSWNGYAPRNYDETFQGPMSVSRALRHSINTTAVQALVEVGFERFADVLEASGMKTVKKQREDLGLSIVLGGCGVTLEELTRLFSTFAREGRVHPLAYTTTEASLHRPGRRLFSPEAAWLIADILSGVERPDLPLNAIAASTRGRIAWKTGTSYGRRDAWSVGFTPRYTVGVWIGNFDGRGVADLSGATVAGPLLFELLNALEAGKTKREFERPLQVMQREICTETGMLPSPNCTHRGQGYYIRDVSPRTVCDQERELYLSADSSMQYCTGCLPATGFIRAHYSVYPAELTLWYENNGVAYPQPPPHNPECTVTFDGPGPQIISPSADLEYLVEEGSGQELLLQAASDARTTRHYWYIDGKFHRSARPGEKVFFAPRAGTIQVSCMDDNGRRAEVKITVKLY
jgi:penicillin-binding protein 1C